MNVLKEVTKLEMAQLKSLKFQLVRHYLTKKLLKDSSHLYFITKPINSNGYKMIIGCLDIY
jgi:citrate lyase synthetase